MATVAFDLTPVQFVIHTVGPVREGGSYDEAEILAFCYRRSRDAADSLGVRSIAFPVIATGLHGVPTEQAGSIARTVDLIRLVASSE